MPWIPTERKEREHSKPVREKYARPAQAHRQVREKVLPLAITAALLAATCCCILYLLLTS